MKIQIISFATAIALLSLILAGCSREQAQQTGVQGPYASTTPPADGPLPDDDYWAKDNLDLRRVGPLVERSRNVEEFERYLNERDGINNLDLNGDGYVDYISVEEFDDRGDGERGLSLFTRFGPDLIQEVATILFRRENPGWPGARVYVAGNEQIYGDNAFYEANWADRALGLASFLFGNQRDRYVSPYYYNSYPAGYQVYEVVETPVYRTRIERLVPEPVFVVAAAPVVTKIKIKSPHNGKRMDKIFARLAKPDPAQVEFIRNNPRKAGFVKVDGADLKGDGPKTEKQLKTDSPAFEKVPIKKEHKAEKHDDKPGKSDDKVGKKKP